MINKSPQQNMGLAAVAVRTLKAHIRPLHNFMFYKSRIKSFLISYSGYGHLKWKYKPKGLYCFNYHRIGDPGNTPFDPNVFSCTKEMFEKHLLFYKENFEVINIDKLFNLIEQGKLLEKHYALITFDDGYKDNYDIAFPILNKNKIPAVFFVPTNYIESCDVPWWDEVAWMIRQCDLSSVQLSGWKKSIIINRKELGRSLRKIINEIKRSRDVLDVLIDDSLKELREKTNSNFVQDRAIFMTWTMLSEMSQNKMCIGSHGRSHHILSKLPFIKQEDEIRLSKQIIEENTGVKVEVFAYPEGGKNTYNEDTLLILKNEKYRLGFNFIPGVKKDLDNNYEIKRFSVSGNCSVNDLKLLSILS